VLEVGRLITEFATRDGVLRAVNDVSFELKAGEILGLVGESGSGKSVLGYSILGLVDPPGRIASGSIRFGGTELVGLPPEQMRRLRGKRIAMIFQDPMMTLNPVLSIETQMVETVLAHENLGKEKARDICIENLARVGIAAPEKRLKQYPHEFSGGMRQRVAIAIALLHRPELVIADEPTTALDVTVQGQILYEMQRLVREAGAALVWITHDLSVVAGLADRVAVMYAGRIVEQGSADQVLYAPRHPYTRGLLDSIPANNEGRSRLRQIPGMTPSLARLPGGCAFRERCGYADSACFSARSSKTTPLSPSPVLELVEVSKRFGKRLDAAERSRARLEPMSPSRRCTRGRVSFKVGKGEVVGLVGESGCGKSTLGRLACGLMEPSSGSVLYEGKPPGGTRRPQMIFQDPFASLNPRMRVEQIIGEARWFMVCFNN
jgi:oligopeptide/dipeptide ABC transporter ATP-binding protein